jgi:hypothetical protein
MTKQSRQIIKTHDVLLVVAALPYTIHQSFAPAGIIRDVKDGNKRFSRADVAHGDVAHADLARHVKGSKAEKAGQHSSPQSISIASRRCIPFSFSCKIPGEWNPSARFPPKSPNSLSTSLCRQVNSSTVGKE